MKMSAVKITLGILMLLLKCKVTGKKKKAKDTVVLSDCNINFFWKDVDDYRGSIQYVWSVVYKSTTTMTVVLDFEVMFDKLCRSHSYLSNK
jgi:hypothetical protein